MKKEIVKQYLKSLFFTIVPFVIPFVFSIPEYLINKISQFIIVVILSCVDIYFVLKYSKQDAILFYKSEELLFNNKKYNISQRVLNRVVNCEKIKGELIKDETYKVHYDYNENILLYNPHRYLERVCEEIKSLISDVTNIELEYISVSFIYQYPTFSDEWSGWQWITGKDSTTNIELNQLINKRDSYYHFLISNDTTTSFENDKSKLIPKHYYIGEKDTRHGTYGSITAHKMSFRNNDCIFCHGYLTISTYGKRFWSDFETTSFKSESEFEQILFDFIIPPFRKIIETELGFLYMRHKYREEIKNREK